MLCNLKTGQFDLETRDSTIKIPNENPISWLANTFTHRDY